MKKIAFVLLLAASVPANAFENYRECVELLDRSLDLISVVDVMTLEAGGSHFLLQPAMRTAGVESEGREDALLDAAKDFSEFVAEMCEAVRQAQP